jgi:hypothetical protein
LSRRPDIFDIKDESFKETVFAESRMPFFFGHGYPYAAKHREVRERLCPRLPGNGAICHSCKVKDYLTKYIEIVTIPLQGKGIN